MGGWSVLWCSKMEGSFHEIPRNKLLNPDWLTKVIMTGGKDLCDKINYLHGAFYQQFISKNNSSRILSRDVWIAQW